MDSVATFADQVARYQRWLLSNTDQGAAAVRECLIQLLELYRAGLELPPAWSDELTDRQDVDRVSDVEWQRAYNVSRRLPLDHYTDVFDPTEDRPDEGPVIANLADDLADIYRDVVSGLRAYEQGDRADAVWEWSFGLHHHWGAHAVDAIRAAHWWLCNNDPDRLSTDRAG
jgi:hypothetical protein